MFTKSSFVMLVTTGFISAPIEPLRAPDLEVEELPRDVARRTGRDARNVRLNAVEIAAVADRAGDDAACGIAVH